MTPDPEAETGTLVGIGFRASIARWTLMHLDCFDVLEVTIDHSVKGGERVRRSIRNLVVRVPLVLHGVGLSIRTETGMPTTWREPSTTWNRCRTGRISRGPGCRGSTSPTCFRCRRRVRRPTCLRIPAKPITDSGVKPITQSGQADHLSERSDGRVAPGDCSPEALTRTGQGDCHHPAPPLMCLVAILPKPAPPRAGGEAGTVPAVC